jgi:hypothetical protein
LFIVTAFVAGAQNLPGMSNALFTNCSVFSIHSYISKLNTANSTLVHPLTILHPLINAKADVKCFQLGIPFH